MIEYLAELDEGHLRLRPGVLDDLAPEGLAKGVCAQVLDLDLVFLLGLLQELVQALRAIDGILLGHKDVAAVI